MVCTLQNVDLNTGATRFLIANSSESTFRLCISLTASVSSAPHDPVTLWHLQPHSEKPTGWHVEAEPEQRLLTLGLGSRFHQAEQMGGLGRLIPVPV